ESPQGKFAQNGSARGEYLIGNLAVLRGVDHVDSGSPDRDGVTMCLQSPRVGGGIHTSRHPTEYDEPAGRKVAGQALGHTRSVGCWMPCANHSNPWLIYNFGISSKVKHERRIINFQQPPGKFRVPRNDDGSAEFPGMVKFGIS